MTFEEEKSRFFENLGRAITQWSDVELELFSCYHQLIRSARWDAESAAFHTVYSFELRMSMTESALKIQTDDKDLLSEWSALKNDARDLHTHRSRFAHFCAVNMLHDKEGRRMILRQGLLNAKGLPKLRIYVASEIADFIPKFGVLARRFEAFAERIQNEIPRPEEP